MECFQYARNAYGPIEDFTGLTNLSKIDSIPGSGQDAVCYCGETETSLVFAFRGTDSVSDMFIDIQIYRDRTPSEMQVNEGYIHRGFHLQYQSIRSAIVEKIASTTKPLIFTGHSLGGALATLFALSAKVENPSRHVTCVTFGSPKVGNAAFVKAFEKVDVSSRVVNNHDGVTYRPTFGYAHVKNLKAISNASVENTVFTYIFGSSRDHSLTSYYKSLTEPGKPHDNMPLTILLVVIAGVIIAVRLYRRR